MSSMNFMAGLKPSLTNRRQSHDNIAKLRNNQMSATMGSGLREQPNILLSPRDVI